MHTEECFVAIDFGESGSSCEDVCNILKGWSFVVLMDYGFIYVFGVKTDS